MRLSYDLLSDTNLSIEWIIRCTKRKLAPMKRTILICLCLVIGTIYAQDHAYQLAMLKYNGGGDWYANPSALNNLVLFTNSELGTDIDPEYEVVEPMGPDIFNYPFVHMTGHGNVVFDEAERRNLRMYLESGGFLHIDDNYGMDKFIRPEIQKLFPDKQLIPLSPDHPIFSSSFNFPDGLPKIHEHDKRPPQAFAIYLEDRMVLLYTFESDLSDGWEDSEVHNDPPEIRRKALQMGANILTYVFMGSEGS